MKYFLLLVLSFALLFACGKHTETGETGETPKNSEAASPTEAGETSTETVSLSDAERGQITLTLAQASIHNVEGQLAVNGSLEVPPNQMQEISSLVEGQILGMNLIPGQTIRKGEKLAEVRNLNLIEMQQDYLDLSAQLEYADLEYQRQQQLSAEKLNAQKATQQAKANYGSLKARVAGLKQQLLARQIDLTNLEAGNFKQTFAIIAPFSGYISAVSAKQGRFVTPSQSLCTLVNTQALHAELKVFDSDIAFVKPGARVQFQVPNDPQNYVASVHLIGKEVSQDRSINVHCDLAGAAAHLIAGTYIRAQIRTQSQQVLSFPESCIQRFGNKTYVFVPIATNEYQLTEVKLGIENKEWVQIQSPEIAQVVSEGGHHLLAKLKNVEEAE